MEKRVIWLAVLGLIAVFVALTLAFYFNPKDLVWKVVLAGIAELGFAALIAVFIIQTIDKHEKENYRKEIVHSQSTLAEYGFSAYITGINVPDAILSRFGQIIGGDGVIKRWQLSEIDLSANGETVQFDLKSEYVAYNASRYPTEFSVPLYADAATKTVHLKIHKRDQAGDWKLLTQRDIIDTSELAGTGGKLQSAANLSLQPNEEVRVEVAFSGLKEPSDSHLNSNTMNALRYELTVKYLPSQFKLGARFASAFSYDESTELNEAGQATLKLRQEAPFLKGSSAYIYWQPAHRES
jgi:hypothetical protein